MKQLILIERSELDALRRGATLNLTLNGGQTVTIGLEQPRRSAGGSVRSQGGAKQGTGLPPDVHKRILALAKAGTPQTRIARELGIASRTVWTHIHKAGAGPGQGPHSVVTPTMLRRIRRLRDTRHLSYKAIAKKVGITEKTVRIHYHASK